jgi:hypothetical protein
LRLILDILLVDECPRIGLDRALPAASQLDLERRDAAPLFREPVRDDRNNLFMEEVQHAMVHSGVLHPKLVDSIPRIVGLGTTELMSELR